MLPLGEITMRGSLAAGAVITLLMAVLQPAKADDVPALNVDQVCRGIAQQAAAPGEKGGPDLSLEQCISSEQEVRQRLVRQWSTLFPPIGLNALARRRQAANPVTPTFLRACKWRAT
jgi:hypothetical protein